jgi:hypothetical protein
VGSSFVTVISVSAYLIIADEGKSHGHFETAILPEQMVAVELLDIVVGVCLGFKIAKVFVLFHNLRRNSCNFPHLLHHLDDQPFRFSHSQL